VIALICSFYQEIYYEHEPETLETAQPIPSVNTRQQH
jgi:hypothetical protein